MSTDLDLAFSQYEGISLYHYMFKLKRIGLRKYLGSYYLVNKHTFNIKITSKYQAIKQHNATLQSQRTSAREKLTRLTKTQFFELSTDVADEMRRRVKNSSDGIKNTQNII